MNSNKFCFIICTNDDLYYNECANYISRLNVPEGYEVDILEIRDAKSMTSGYNEGMAASDAKFKIYMHQDVFILYPNFLQALLDIFNKYPNAGMIGMAGVEKMPEDGIMWHEKEVGNLYGLGKENSDNIEYVYDTYDYSVEDGAWNVECIDGLMMITCVDLPWREDIFDGWDFYDVSQSFEMRKQGKNVLVPIQNKAWVLHDDGVLNLRNYDKYRKIFLEEYEDMLG